MTNVQKMHKNFTIGYKKHLNAVFIQWEKSQTEFVYFFLNQHVKIPRLTPSFNLYFYNKKKTVLNS